MAFLGPGQAGNVTALLLGRVGDLIVATPFLRSLRQRFPKARIRLVTSARCAEAAALIPFIDEFRILRRWPQIPSNLKTALELLARPCDFLADLNPSFSRSSAAIARLVRSPVKLAFQKGRWDGIFTHQAAPAGKSEHMLDRYARLAQALEAPYEPRMELRLSPDDEEKAEDLINGWNPKPVGLRVLIHPGNFKKFENRWPEEKFVELTNRLLQDPAIHLCYMAGPGEEPQARGILSRLKRPAPLLPPSPLGLTGALMKRMDLCVLNVTGTTHLAAALGCPTFGFYSGYTDAVWRPRGPRHWGAVSSSWESCRGISVDEAYAALEPALLSLASR